MDTITVAFLTVLYVVPVLLVFALLAVIAEWLEGVDHD
jgi:hypothetical protein